jgi:hypothetical protein
METKFELGETSEMLQTALNRLKNCNCHIMPILSGDKLVGILNMENVGEFLMIHTALKKSGEAGLQQA